MEMYESMNGKIYIDNIPEITAIYFALMQCGYEFQSMGRSTGEQECVRRFIDRETHPFFAEVKQDSCAVYPYWPRAAMLETASFFLCPEENRFTDLNALRKQIMTANNITDAQRDDAFWSWFEDFPQAIHNVMNSSVFREYWKWENNWILEQQSLWKNELDHLARCINACVRQYDSPIQEVVIVLNPIKCIYSADCHIVDDKLFFSSGRLSVKSVIHEFLHHLVHPIVWANRQTVLCAQKRYPDIDQSYYLDGDQNGRLNAFEEYLVRLLTEDVFSFRIPDQMDSYLKHIVSGLE